jgi:hypothetical protein
MAKKNVAAKPAKKVAAPKSTKAAKSVKQNGVVNVKAQLKFVSFSVRAVIPTQQYGNLQPEITVEAPSYEEARAFVMPLIEDLYRQYAESRPGFLGKVVETEKVVATAPTAAPAGSPAPQGTTNAWNKPASNQSAQTPPVDTSSIIKPKPVLKAEKAINLAVTDEAAALIQDQIEKSVKIPAEYKPDLITKVLEKRSSLK